LELFSFLNCRLFLFLEQSQGSIIEKRTGTGCTMILSLLHFLRCDFPTCSPTQVRRGKLFKTREYVHLALNYADDIATYRSFSISLVPTFLSVCLYLCLPFSLTLFLPPFLPVFSLSLSLSLSLHIYIYIYIYICTILSIYRSVFNKESDVEDA
jgi:hypothetical protein